MAGLNTPALVLRHADYGDYDRMVTLFTPEYGRIEAIARGCRRPKSALVNAVEPFVSGEFQLFFRKERYSIDQCQIHESFYELRTDYDRLLHGVYWLKLLDAVVMPESPADTLFMMTLRALAHLNYSNLPPEMLTMAFEMHLMANLGFAPMANACVHCGCSLDSHCGFDPHAGGTVCSRCDPYAPFLSNEARRVLYKLPRTKFDSVAHLEGYAAWPEAAKAYRKYMEVRLPNIARLAPPLYVDTPQ